MNAINIKFDTRLPRSAIDTIMDEQTVIPSHSYAVPSNAGGFSTVITYVKNPLEVTLTQEQIGKFVNMFGATCIEVAYIN